MSSRHLQDMSERRLQGVLQDAFNTSSKRLQDVFARRLQDVLEDVKLLRWRRVADVLKTNKCLLGSNSQPPTRSLRFLYELKPKIHLSKTVCGIFHFRFGLLFIKISILLQQTTRILWAWSLIIPFKIKIREKLRTVLIPDLRFLSCNKNFENSMISVWVGAPKTWFGGKRFQLRILKYWSRSFFLNSNLK